MVRIKIHWNGFLALSCQAYPKEACAMLYAKKPFSQEQEWHVFPLRNESQQPETSWTPNKNDLSMIKRKADKQGLIKIGNIHTHPLPQKKEYQNLNDKTGIELWKETGQPSETDLSYAKKFNDIIRGILVVDEQVIYHHVWHDKHGNIISIEPEETP